MITPLGAEHVGQVARLHDTALTGLLARLGAPAAVAFYSGCTKSRLAIGFVDVVDGNVRGFVVGSMHPDRLNADVLRRNPFGVVLSLASGVVKRPANLSLLFNSVSGGGGAGYDRRAPSLVYLAVAPDGRRAGVGRSLVEAFSARMRAAGAAYYDLSVDDDNASAIAFYEQLGFRVTGSYREFGKLHRRYRLTLA